MLGLVGYVGVYVTVGGGGGVPILTGVVVFCKRALAEEYRMPWMIVIVMMIPLSSCHNHHYNRCSFECWCG